MSAVLLVQLDVNPTVKLLAQLKEGRKESRKRGRRGDSETSSAHNNGHYILGSAHTHTRWLPVGPPRDLVDSQFKLVLQGRSLISSDLWLTSIVGHDEGHTRVIWVQGVPQ